MLVRTNNSLKMTDGQLELVEDYTQAKCSAELPKIMGEERTISKGS